MIGQLVQYPHPVEQTARAVGETQDALLSHLLTRRSVAAAALGEPGPTPSQLETMLTIAARVPDHKKLAPWRFIVIEGGAREALGEVVAASCLEADRHVTNWRLETERGRFTRAPMVVAVISSVKRHPAAPEWEQVLSAGAVCLNLLHAAAAMGFSGQLLTEWYAYDKHVQAALGLAGNERIAGFIHIGTAKETPAERERPDLSGIVTYLYPLSNQGS